MFPDVYLANDAPVSLRTRTIAAWLWSRRRAVIVGGAASGLHGSNWIPDNFPVELNHANTHPPDGVLIRRCALSNGETQVMDGRVVTTPANPSVTTPASLGGQSASEQHISTLTDSIILLRYIQEQETMHRGLMVLKMRGSEHAKEIRRFTIDGRGMHLGDAFKDAPNVFTGVDNDLTP